MIKSMTGFGRSEYSDEKRSIVVEIKSVNHRYCDVSMRMPRRYSFAEEKLKALVKQYARRGKIEVSIMVDNLTDEDSSVKLNTLAAHQYYENLQQLKNEFGLEGEVTLPFLASLPDVMKSVPDLEDEDEVCRSLSIPVEEAAKKLDEMRIVEGKKLAEDILMRGDLIRDLVKQIELQAPETVKNYTVKLKERIAELVDGAVEIPEDRILLEAAIFADKANITEEMVRLDSHIRQLKDIIGKSNQPDGKKLDFLVQEMNREANTIGSKANDLTITNTVLDIKSEVEKIREQVQNIE